MDWLSVAQDELNRIQGSHADKKRATVLALVDAHLAGRSEETVWDLPGACSRNTYHAKWKRDPVFADVLEKVDQLARGWRDGRALRALQEAAEELALASPASVRRLVAIMGQNDDFTNARLAATAILDRAGMETASKSSTETSGSVEVTSEIFSGMMRQAQADATALEDDVLAHGWQPDADQVPGG